MTWAARHGKGAKLLVDATDLGSMGRDMSLSREFGEADATVYGSSFRSFLPGFRSGEFSYEGLFEGSATGTHEKLNAILGSTSRPIVTYGPEGSTVGRTAVIFRGVETAFDTASPFDDVVSVTATLRASSAIDDGVWLRTLSTAATTGGSTHYDSGTTGASTAGAVAHLHVTSFTTGTGASTDTVTIKVQHSSNASAWADYLTFTNPATTANRAQHSTASASLKRYWRERITAKSTATALTYAVSFARR